MTPKGETANLWSIFAPPPFRKLLNFKLLSPLLYAKQASCQKCLAVVNIVYFLHPLFNFSSPWLSPFLLLFQTTCPTSSKRAFIDSFGCAFFAGEGSSLICEWGSRRRRRRRYSCTAGRGIHFQVDSSLFFSFFGPKLENRKALMS